MQMSTDIFHKWRAADRTARVAEKAVLADSLGAIAGTCQLPIRDAIEKTKGLRVAADDLFQEAMREMSDSRSAKRKL